MIKVTRRTFVACISAAAAVPPAALLGPAATEAAPHSRGTAAPATPYLFFDAHEARFVEPACERLIPHDEAGPGAFGAQVAAYLDRQLAGPWGQGLTPYRTGPWQPGTLAATAGVSSPATLFRAALKAINSRFESQGTYFSELDATTQASYLRALACGTVALDGVPAAAFFDLLLSMTVEGFFTGSSRAQNRGMIAWPLKGFPGAYFREVDKAHDGSGNVYR